VLLIITRTKLTTNSATAGNYFNCFKRVLKTVIIFKISRASGQSVKQWRSQGGSPPMAGQKKI